MESAVSFNRAARLSEFSADTQHVAPAQLTQGILMEASFRLFGLPGFLRARMIMFAYTIGIASQGIGAEKAKLALSPAIASPRLPDLADAPATEQNNRAAIETLDDAIHAAGTAHAAAWAADCRAATKMRSPLHKAG